MSYVPVSSLRSNRFPLAGSGDGLGCACSSPPIAGLGLDFSSLFTGFSVAGAGATGLVLGYFLGKHAQRRGLALNRRRR